MKPVIDYPNIRRDPSCPFCTRTKTHGLLVCWPCYRTEGLRYGENARQATILEAREQRLIELSSETGRGI